MTIQEKIARLQQLFTQRADIDREIEILLGNIPEVKKAVAKKVIESKPVKEHGKPWSKKHDKCVSCGSTENRHKSGGYCVKCYRSGWTKKKELAKPTKDNHFKTAPDSSKGRRLTNDDKKQIAEMFANGISAKVIMGQFNISSGTFENYKHYVENKFKDEKRYYCRDCKKVFKSTYKMIDVVCPSCDSVHIDYAARYNK